MKINGKNIDCHHHLLFIFECIILLWFHLVPTCLSVQGQTINYKHISRSEGLPSSTVWAVTQDQDGYIWLGTSNGLTRFDGTDFVLYDKSNNLPGNSITALYYDQIDNQIWAGAYRLGLAKVDSNFNVTTVEDSKSSKYRIANHITQINDELFWEGGRHYIVSYNLTNQQCNKLLFPKPTRSLSMMRYQDKLLVGTNTGLYQKNGDQLKRVYDDFVKDNPIRTIEIAEDQTLWLSSLGKIFFIKTSGEQGIISKGIQEKKEINTMLQDHKGQLWVSVIGEGLHQLIGDSLVFIGNKLGLGKTQVNHLFEDNKNNIWIATFGNGLYCIPNNLFDNYTEENNLSNNVVNVLFSDQYDNAIYIGTLNGLNKFEDGKISQIPINSGMPFDYISKIKRDGAGHIIFSNSLLKERFKSFKEQGQSFVILGRVSKEWEITDDGYLLIYGAPKGMGLNKLSFDKKGAYRVLSYTEIKKNKDLGRIKSVVKTKDQQIWLGAERGIYIVVENNDLYTLVFPNNLPECLKTSNINDVFEDQYRKIWVVSNCGLYVFDNNQWQHWTVNDGLQDNNIKTIVQDKEGFYWIGTKKGLNKFDGENFFPFTIDDGLLSDEINHLYYDSLKNELWIGTVQGFSSLKLDKTKFVTNPQIPLFIEYIKTNDYEFIRPQKNIELAYNQNDFTIKYNALNFTNPKSLLFQYRLHRHTKNNDNKWRDTQNKEIELYDLKDGQYIFELRAKTQTSGWSGIQQATFDIRPPFWKNKCFIALCIFLTGLLLIYFIKLILNRITYKAQQELELNRQMTNLEQQALSAMMSPHFIFNALNSIQHFMNTERKEEGNEYLSIFAEIIRLNLDLANQPSITLEEETARLKLYLKLEKLRFGSKLNWSINIGDEVETESLLIPSMILQPFVENAILHGILPKEESGMIKIHIQNIDDSYLSINIEDNGIGIMTSKQAKKNLTHNSKGITISKDRIEHFGSPNNKNSLLSIKELKNPNDEVIGSQILIHLPLLYR